MPSIMSMFRRAKQILETEGLQPLFSRGSRFLVDQLFEYKKYYLYENTTRQLNEADFLPKISNFNYKVVSSNQEADELAATGLDFRSTFVNARQSLDRGAIAFCIFVNGDLAHIGWAAMNEEAKKGVERLPYYVDFANRQACTGSVWTNPKYRGKGLMTYGYMKRLQFLRENGIETSRHSLTVDNVASKRATAKLHPQIWGKACYFRILRWGYYKEMPMTENELVGLHR